MPIIWISIYPVKILLLASVVKPLYNGCNIKCCEPSLIKYFVPLRITSFYRIFCWSIIWYNLTFVDKSFISSVYKIIIWVSFFISSKLISSTCFACLFKVILLLIFLNFSSKSVFDIKFAILFHIRFQQLLHS